MLSYLSLRALEDIRSVHVLSRSKMMVKAWSLLPSSSPKFVIRHLPFFPLPHVELSVLLTCRIVVGGGPIVLLE